VRVRAVASVAFALALVATAACGPSAPGASAPGANVVPKSLSATEGVVVTAGCTPTGPELCFNATDDNCNGVIDEGCGVGTGVLQFTIAWGESPADVDLAVIDPNGAHVSRSSRTTPSGLHYERNCPDEGCHEQNAENVYFDGTEPVRGTYQVEVVLADARNAELPVKVHLSARIGSRTWAMDFALAPTAGQDRQGFKFEL
jgi:tRNA (guanosine-2'-O-)-methyltransferase